MLKGIEILFLAIGGVLGTFLRFKITESPLIFGAIPINVLIVNVVGAFILGMFVVFSQQINLDSKYAFLVAVGFCGSLTTMSAFALETASLIENLQYILVAVNILANVGLSILAIMGGRALMTVILSSSQ